MRAPGWAGVYGEEYTVRWLRVGGVLAESELSMTDEKARRADKVRS